MSTSNPTPREVIERYVAIHRTGDTSSLGEIIAPDFRYRLSAPVGVEGVAAGVRTIHRGFSEITCSLEQLVSEDDWAAFRFVIAGRHTGVFAGRAATGRLVTWGGADFVRLQQGKLVELWSVQESLPLMEGIGAVARTERSTTLRDVTEDDLPIFFEHQRQPDANRLAAWPARDHSAFMAHWRTAILDDSSARKQTIVLAGHVAGNVVSWTRDGERLVGYWIGQAYWGRGAASAALAEFVADHEKSRPLYAEVAVHNVGSIRVLEKCGFRQLGDAVRGPDGIEEIRMCLGATGAP